MPKALLLGCALIAGTLSITAADTTSGAPAKPTFTKNVAPILYARCVVCHRKGDVGPMQLITYEQVRPWSAALKQAVLERKMPPWFADPHVGKFKNDRRMTDDEIATVVNWVNSGSPKGDEKDLPAVPQFADGWSFERPPDAVIEMPLEAKVEAKGVYDILNYYVKVPFSEDKFVEAVELRPGNRAVVHHSIVNIVKLPEGLTEEQLISGKKYGTTGWKLVGQAPGKGALVFLPGTAKRISPGYYLEFNMHYTPTGKPETDRSVIGIWFAKGPIHHEVLSRVFREETLIEGKKLERGGLPNIPANVDNWEIEGRATLRDDITLYAMSPHMHFRGKDMKYVVKYPDGHEEVLLNVPHYNYEWQLNYELAKPAKIPAGSVVTVYAHYDNSKNNPRNPAPDEEVIWGQQSWNEMFIPWSEYSIDKLDLTKLTKEQIQKLQQRPGVRDPEQ